MASVSDLSTSNDSPLGFTTSEDSLTSPVDGAVGRIGLRCISTPSPQLFEPSLVAWCDEKKGDAEYAKRVIAAERITKAALDNSAILNLSNLGLTSLPDHLGTLTHLESLHLNGNRLANVDVLGRLVRLKSLYLHMNLISNIAPLRVLNQLQTLSIFNNQIADTRALAEMPCLRRLDIGGNRITDLRPIGVLTELQRLGLAGNQVVDVSPLSRLVKLERLELAGNPVVDIRPLGSMIRLENLILAQTLIEGIPLSLAEMGSHATIDATDTPLIHTAIREFQDAIQCVRKARADLGPEFILPFTADVSPYDMVADLGFPAKSRPVIARAAHASSPAMGPKTSILLAKLGAIPFEVDVTFPNIEPRELFREVQQGIERLRKSGDAGLSVPVQLLNMARENTDDFPLIGKIQNTAAEVMLKCQGLSLPGGPDIERELYDEASAPKVSDFRRTIGEFALADAALRQRKPIMGNCRGAQLVNVLLGGTLKIAGSVGWGTIEISDSSKKGRLLALLGDEPVNTYSQHFQSCDRLGKGLEVVMEHNKIPKLIMSQDEMVLGVQTHPEYDESGRYSKAIEIYRIFFGKIKQSL